MTDRRKPVQKPAQPPRTCRDFLDEWNPQLKDIAPDVELDFSWSLDGITATDMRTPSALRTRLLYRKSEVENRADQDGDFERRIGAFMGSL
jgi:hypothetical protein